MSALLCMLISFILTEKENVLQNISDLFAMAPINGEVFIQFYS